MCSIEELPLFFIYSYKENLFLSNFNGLFPELCFYREVPIRLFSELLELESPSWL